MKRSSLFAGSLAMLVILTTAAALTAQGRGTAPGQSLAAPVFDETVVVAPGSVDATFTLPANVEATFDRAVVDVQVLEPPGPFGRATTNFLTLGGPFGISPTPVLWSRFGNTINVLPSTFGMLAGGQEIRVRVWLHR